MFKKLFKTFLREKKQVHILRNPDVRVQEIWWAREHDTNMQKPVLVFRMLGDKLLWCLPLTSRAGKGEAPLYVLSSLASRNRAAALSKMRVLSRHELTRRAGKMSTAQFDKINAAIMLFLTETTPAKPRPLAPTHRIRSVRAPLGYRGIPSPFIPALSLR